MIAKKHIKASNVKYLEDEKKITVLVVVGCTKKIKRNYLYG